MLEALVCSAVTPLASAVFDASKYTAPRPVHLCIYTGRLRIHDLVQKHSSVIAESTMPVDLCIWPTRWTYRVGLHEQLDKLTRPTFAQWSVDVEQ